MEVIVLPPVVNPGHVTQSVQHHVLYTVKPVSEITWPSAGFDGVQ